MLAPQTFSADPDRALLEHLAAKASQPYFIADMWAADLAKAPELGETAATFASQLRQEWFSAPVQDGFCHLVMSRVRSHLISSGEPWQNLWAHTLRVAGYALHIASDADVEPSHAYLLAIMHDVGKLDEMKTGVSHERIGAMFAQNLLMHESDFSPMLIARMVSAIAKTGSSRDPFVRLLYDADKLDKIGATGILRRVTAFAATSSPFMALRYVQSSLKDFPDLYHTDSEALATLKRNYTKRFLGAYRQNGRI
ncbi:MAG: hypothetical protein OHK0023_13390 [Anaerolineae bacterium]